MGSGEGWGSGGPHYARDMSRSLAAVSLAVVLAACSSGGGPEDGADSADAVPASEASLAPEVDTAEVPRTPSAPAPSEEAAEADSGSPAAPLEPSEPFTTDELTLVSPDGEATAVGVYVAAEPDQRQRGLMDREELRDDAGMVFLFPGVATSSFYMFNTLIPLQIAFFDADGRIVSVLDMEPCESEDPSECELYDPGAEYSGALEVNQGFFDELGLDEAWTVELPDGLPTAS